MFMRVKRVEAARGAGDMGAFKKRECSSYGAGMGKTMRNTGPLGASLLHTTHPTGREKRRE